MDAETRLPAMPKVAIITGGSTGIGKSLGGALVARGDTVILAARTESDVRDSAAELTARGGGRAMAAVLDVRDSAAVADCVGSVYQEHGRLDLMVNNAGIAS